MGANPFDPNDPEPYVPLSQRAPVAPPISGANPFEPPPEGIKHAEDPGTLLSNVADVLKPASNTFSFGMRDRLEGLYRRLTGEAPSVSEGIDQAVADSAMRRERSPYLSVVGDVAGGTAQAAVPGIGATGRNISLALGGAGRGAMPAAARALGYGIEGGLLGGAQAAGHTYSGRPEDYAKNAIIGGALGTVLGAPGGAAFADVAPRSLAKTPTSKELMQSSRDSYTATHQIPIDYSAKKFWNGVDALEQTLYGTTNQVKSPTVWEVMRLAREGRAQANKPGVVGATVSPKNIDELRQQLSGVREPGASAARQWLDSFMQQPQNVVRGTDAQRNAITQRLLEARGDYHAAKRTQAIEDINQYAADKGIAPQAQLKTLLNPKGKEGKYYTEQEKDDVRRAVSKLSRGEAMTTVGNLMGGGGGVPMGMYGAGSVTGALASGDLKPLLAAAIPVAGKGVMALGNRAKMTAAEDLADTMAMRSPLYRQRAANAPVVAGPGLGNISEATRNALTIEMLNQLRLRGGLYGEQ